MKKTTIATLLMIAFASFMVKAASVESDATFAVISTPIDKGLNIIGVCVDQYDESSTSVNDIIDASALQSGTSTANASQIMKQSSSGYETFYLSEEGFTSDGVSTPVIAKGEAVWLENKGETTENIIQHGIVPTTASVTLNSGYNFVAYPLASDSATLDAFNIVVNTSIANGESHNPFGGASALDTNNKGTNLTDSDIVMFFNGVDYDTYFYVGGYGDEYKGWYTPNFIKQDGLTLEPGVGFIYSNPSITTTTTVEF